MSKRKQTSRKLITKTLVSVFVLAVFLIPLFQAADWAHAMIKNRDTRSVETVAPFQTRTIDLAATAPTPFKQPIITITFDDGWESIYNEALPILQKYGFHTSQYIITNTFDNRNYMSIDQIKSMQNAGHDIASHTVSHPDLMTISDSDIRKELSDSQNTLNREFGGPTIDFTSPYGSFNDHDLEIVSQYYRSQKSAEGDPRASNNQSINTKATFKPMDIKSYSIRKTTSLSDLKELVRQAQTTNGWLVLTYHQVDNSNEEYSVTPKIFEQQMAYLSGLNMRSATVNQVLNQILPVKKERH